ncbi:MAG: alpha/beta fold hydrolase [Pseudonocardia sp.]|nr:alpha/beta fold hydrolase [Pseudonocardia sp.]
MTEYARNGAVEIAYEDLGGAGGDPLLLLMGLGVSRFWWPDGFVAELVASGFHVVAYDQRDAGESTRFTDAGGGNPIARLFRRRTVYTAEDMTDDAIAVLDAVGWPAAHLLGASMGAALAQATALRHPARVLSLTACSGGRVDIGMVRRLRTVRPGVLVNLMRMRFPEGREGDVAAGVAMARAMAAPDRPFDEAAARATAERDSVSGVRDPDAQSRQMGASWSGGPVSGIDVPVLVLHGAQDPLIRPSSSRDLAAAIPGARLRVLPGMGHDLPAALWPEIAREIRGIADAAVPRT